MRTGNSYYFLNLGCPKNQVDGNYIRGALNSLGFTENPYPDLADYLIVNTCAFIEQARQETLGEINELVPYKKNGVKLIAVGCYPSIYDIKRVSPSIDAAFGLNQVDKLLKFVTGKRNVCCNNLIFNRVVENTPYAYVKISDGCNNRCSYCTIPLIRGSYRSIPHKLIIDEVELLANKGIKEIIFVAQDTTLYGKDLKGGLDLADLCRMVSDIDGIEWIRIMYAHPAHLDDNLISRLFEIEKVCRYIDLPIQHISDKILSLMNRHCGTEKIKHIIKQLRNVDKNISLRTTLMVGFPGETDDDFKELVDFIEEIKFDYLGIFCYSPEENTAAISLEEKFDPQMAEEKLEMLYNIAEEISEDRAIMQIGKKQKLLIESQSAENSGFYEARSCRQAPEIDGFYNIPARHDITPGQFVEAEIMDIDSANIIKGI